MDDQLIPESVHEGNAIPFLRVEDGKFLDSQFLDGISRDRFCLQGESQKVSKNTVSQFSNIRLLGKRYYGDLKGLSPDGG